MTRSQRVSFADGGETYTVLGADHLPVPAVVDYLQFLRDDAASPHTIRADAAGLARWWTVLKHTGIDWREIRPGCSGVPDLPAHRRPARHLADRRAGGVVLAVDHAAAGSGVAFYRYHADAHGLVEPRRWLYSVGVNAAAPATSRCCPGSAGPGRPTRSGRSTPSAAATARPRRCCCPSRSG